MNCFVNEGTIYDRQGNVIQPDEQGIIVLQVDDKPRRFVKDKLVDWLKRNNKIIPPPKIKVKRTIESPKVATQNRNKKNRPAKYTIRNVRKVRTDFTRKGFKITANKNGIVYGPFISITKCAEAIKVSKSQISKVLRGDARTKTGFEFFKL